MTKSQVVNRWIQQGEQAGILKSKREDLILALEERFPGQVSAEMVDLVNKQDSLELLRDWIRAAVRAKTVDDFIAVLRR